MTSKQEERKKNPTVKTIGATRKSILITILAMGALIILIAPLAHIGFPVENPAVTAFKKELAADADKKRSELTLLKNRFENGELNAIEYEAKRAKASNTLETTLASHKNLISEKIDQERLFGWSSTRKFLIGFGIRLPYLVFSIIISMLIARIKTKDTTLKKTFFWLQTACYTITLYVLVWCFWYVQDYPFETYWYAAILFCGIAGLFCAHAFKYYESNIIKIVKLKGAFLNFIVEIRNEHYKPLLKKAMRQDLYNETYQEELKNNTKTFEKRLHDKAEELID